MLGVPGYAYSLFYALKRWAKQMLAETLPQNLHKPGTSLLLLKHLMYAFLILLSSHFQRPKGRAIASALELQLLGGCLLVSHTLARQCLQLMGLPVCNFVTVNVLKSLYVPCYSSIHILYRCIHWFSKLPIHLWKTLKCF